MDYETFLRGKLAVAQPTGIESPEPINPALFAFQADLTRWALKRGRAAIFAGTGLGKSRMQVEWAHHVHRHTDANVLILAPLAVAAQTVAEGAKIGVPVTLCRDANDVCEGINITNYDRLHKFDPSEFGAVGCDESSVIKHADTATFATLCREFRETRFKLCCTATPAPNDWTELGTHAEFLGICTKAEMLSEFFVHDGGETQVWRLKGHAREAFWRWVASWGALVSHPRDLGYDDVKGYDLPPLNIHEHTIKAGEAEARAAGLLFVAEAGSLMERRTARRVSIGARVAACAAQVNAEPEESWVVWCDLNAESEALTEAIPGAVEITGSMDADEKERRLMAFAAGEARTLVTKSSIAGHGLNWQHCARTAFVGVTDSWEQYYQALRRFWRFGQTRSVEAHIFASEAEGSVVANVKRKDADAAEMAKALAQETAAMVRAEVRGAARETNDYPARTPIMVPDWLKSEVMA